MNHQMFTLEEVSSFIKSGKRLLVAADENLLNQLPQGDWIGGTIPYFMGKEGGLQSKDKIFANVLSDSIASADLKIYDQDSLPQVYQDGADNGFSMIILPAFSQVHSDFALKSSEYEGFASKPLAGWISGLHLDDLGSVTPKVYFGKTGEFFEDKAVVMHLALPENQFANINIINLFSQGSGDTLTFLEDGFSAKDVLVNGEKRNLAEYLESINFDSQLPLVADYAGAMINISFQEVTPEETKFYAPIFKGTEYKLAEPVGQYVDEFTQQLSEHKTDSPITFSCNCVLNYLYSELEGRKTEGFTGPATFGEIAYQLLNQTLVYVTIESF